MGETRDEVERHKGQEKRYKLEERERRPKKRTGKGVKDLAVYVRGRTRASPSRIPAELEKA